MHEDAIESEPSQALVRVVDQPPPVLPTVLLEESVHFPGPVVPVLLDGRQRREALLEAKNSSGFFLLLNRRQGQKPRTVAIVEGDLALETLAAISGATAQASEDPYTQEDLVINLGSTPDMPIELPSLNPVGVLARLLKVVRLPDNRLSALVHLMRRAQPIELLKADPFPLVRVLYPLEVVSDEKTFEALYRQVRLSLQAFFNAHPNVSEELKVAALSIEVPGALADFVAQHLSRDFDERLAFLGELDLSKRMKRALEVSIRELDLLTVGNRISQEIREKVEKHQRDYLLREQLKAIRAELGEEKEPVALAIAELREKLDQAGLSAEAQARADEELKRLQLLPPESPEHNVIRSYVGWIASLPWSKLSEDCHDIVKVRTILDEDHYGLQEIKDRIIEFLAVHQLNPHKVGSLLCFAGPPGVGKTSLGKSIARALGREFYRFAVGGIHDEAEIKGHRRTYIGSMPGRIVRGLSQCKTANPVFMIDELDKMGSDWRGDPSSALLEVLDPAQNHAFVDHYLDLQFDLSRVMFIATVNVEAELPAPLRDRLELIDLPGYIPEEKREIGLKYLLPRQRREHGLSKTQLQITPAAIKNIISKYTHEAGVRELERLLAKLCRKRAITVVGGHKGVQRLGPSDLEALLGPPKIFDDRLRRRPAPGVAVGLAWTPAGGEILFIEVVAMPNGTGVVKVTGHLGEVMNESAGLAVSYVRSRAEVLGLSHAIFRKYDFHLHFPAGAIKKDGPSAGVTITTALISLLTGHPLRARLAMTGEMTLRGEILPVGGIREKVVAARRAGVAMVVLPQRNRAQVEEIPLEVRRSIHFIFVQNYDEVLAAAFGMDQSAALSSHRPEALMTSSGMKRWLDGASGSGKRTGKRRTL